MTDGTTGLRVRTRPTAPNNYPNYYGYSVPNHAQWRRYVSWTQSVSPSSVSRFLVPGAGTGDEYNGNPWESMGRTRPMRVPFFPRVDCRRPLGLNP